MTPAELQEKARRCIDWYWAHGIKRKEKFEVGRGTWLDSVYRIRNMAALTERAGSQAKPCLALWGPSQTGKSTLLASSLDWPDDPKGVRGALTWSPDEPIRFVVGSEKEGVLVLNPFNQRSDASGCVSRFYVTDAVPDPLHPVEIDLAGEHQIMHALAAGYLSECAVSNTQREVTNWRSDNFASALETVRAADRIDQTVFESLQQFAETLDLLLMSDLSDRYRNLGPHWESLRAKMLEHPGLLGSAKAVRDFAANILWDSWPSITSLFSRLAKRREELAKAWAGCKIRCNWRTASLLLDIDSYQQCLEHPEVKAKVLALSYSVQGGIVTIGENLGTPLCRTPEDFGLLQGIIWELRIPVRSDVLKERSPAMHRLLSTADLVDFPGVANEQGRVEKLDDAAVAADLQRGLTQVLKRGKTASIVVTRARTLDIDGFSLLMQSQRFPSQPGQLNAGIQSWLTAYGYAWPPHSKVLPVNLVLTFCAQLVNDVRQSGIKHGLGASFGQLSGLGPLVSPKFVTTFATTYPQFDLGRILGTPEEIAEAEETILADSAFQDRFQDNVESFREMVANGGVDFLFDKLAEQAAQSKKPALLAQRLQEAGEKLTSLMREHAPDESSANEKRNRELDEWRKAMEKLLETQAPEDGDEVDSAARLSRHLRGFLNYDYELMDELPEERMNNGRITVKTFVTKQIMHWMAQACRYAQLHELGLKDSAHAHRMLNYLVEGMDVKAVLDFFSENLDNLPRSEVRIMRRFLAVKITTELLRQPQNGSAPPKASNPPRPMGAKPAGANGGDPKQLLARFGAAEEGEFKAEDSPHYHSVIRPLFKRLEFLKTQNAGQRPPQEGDGELLDLLAPSAD